MENYREMLMNEPPGKYEEVKHLARVMETIKLKYQALTPAEKEDLRVKWKIACAKKDMIRKTKAVKIYSNNPKMLVMKKMKKNGDAPNKKVPHPLESHPAVKLHESIKHRFNLMKKRLVILERLVSRYDKTNANDSTN